MFGRPPTTRADDAGCGTGAFWRMGVIMAMGAALTACTGESPAAAFIAAMAAPWTCEVARPLGRWASSLGSVPLKTGVPPSRMGTLELTFRSPSGSPSIVATRWGGSLEISKAKRSLMAL